MGEQKNFKKFWLALAGLVLLGYTVNAGEAFVYEVTNPPDTNQPFVSAHDSVNELDENFISPPFDGNFDFIEEPAQDVYRIENGELIKVNDGDGNQVNGQNNSCDTATPDVYGTIKRSVIDNYQDVDWYKGTRSSNNKVRVVLVPPNNKNYDIEIWDDCDTWRKTCSAGRGELENCVAEGIIGDFYVRVSGVGGDWSAQAPYYLMAYNNNDACRFDLYSGRPVQEPFACMDIIRVDTTRISSRTNETFKLTFRQDLWLPSGDFQNETDAAPYDLPPNGHAYASGRHFAPPNGWPENGYYTARAVIIGYCDGSDAINAAKVNSNPPPLVSCQPCQNECSYNGQKRCNGNNSETCGNYDGDNCLEWGGGQYCPQGCNQQNGQCNSCESHHHEGCFDNDVYWFNSCNEREEKKEDCRVSCNYRPPEEYYCVNGCLGNFAVTAKNQRGVVEQNATVSFRRMDSQDFVFAGLTNSGGNLDFFDIWPHSNACNIDYEIRVVSASGGDCGSRYTRINEEGDRDGIMFTCPIVNNDNFLRVAPDGPERIKLGQILDLRALITDRYYAPVSGALVGVNRPYNSQPLSDTTNDQGNASFLDDRVPAGSHNFQFIGSKIGYNYGEAWKRVTVEPQQVYTAVRDNLGNPVWHAEILLEGVSKGFTDNQGKLAIQVTEQVNTLEAKNTDGIHCGYKTIRIGEQANFICAENPVLRVDVDNNESMPVVNVVVAVDGNFVDYTNVFGFTKSTISSGEHLLEIYYKFNDDENGDVFRQRRNIQINEAETVVEFLILEDNGEKVENLEELYLTGADGQAIPLLALVIGAWIVIDWVSPYVDILFLCDCLSQKASVNKQSCIDTLQVCTNPEIENKSACVQASRELFSFPEACHADYAALGLDALPFIGGVGIAKKVVSVASDVSGKVKVEKLPGTAQNIIQFAKVRGEEAWELTGHAYKYVATRVYDNTPRIVLQIYMRLRGRLTRETTEAIEYLAHNRIFGDTTALKGLKLIDEYGELKDNTGKILASHTKALTRGTKEFAVESWTPAQREGYHKFMKTFDAGQGDATSIGLNEVGVLNENTTKQVMENVKNNSPDVKFDFEIPNSGGKDADFWFKLDGQAYWNESREIITKIRDTPNDLQKIQGAALEKAAKFKDTIEAMDITIEVRLTEGAENIITDTKIKNLLIELYAKDNEGHWIYPTMEKIKRVIVYNAENNKTIFTIGGVCKDFC
ncbi:MAG: hypothetical protein HY392_05035 [Candidatus Diapherotrites archaeon]|nr:hypothetical protein [Candidatus Diapherotrites archaeon]